MKKYVFIILVMALAVYLTGCGRKRETLEETQEPLSIEVSPAASVTSQPTTVAPASEAARTAQIPLPPQGPYKPTNQQIQAALKNAGYYTGEIDGKIGPMTKKAIKDFQAANSLEADGKVGTKTWAALSIHLNPQTVESPSQTKR
jgi:peptidoglycan hydrolase-like protein with peptidoglycan-binding domain